MIKIFENLKPVPEEMEDLAQLIAQPDIEFVGQNFIQKWKDEDGVTKWFGGSIKSVQENKFKQNEFELSYEDDSICFLTKEEIIVDIIRGDFDLT